MTKQISYSIKISTISSNIIGFLYIINIEFWKIYFKPKQHLSQLKKVAKFLKNPKKIPIVPKLLLNDNEIIWDVGLGYESESIDQGRSYEIIYCSGSSQEIYHTLEMVV